MENKVTKTVTFITIISGIITLVSIAFNFLMPLYILHKFKVEINNSSAIGIIGGADGPTVIFLSGQTSPHLITIVFALLTMAGIGYLIYIKRLKR